MTEHSISNLSRVLRFLLGAALFLAVAGVSLLMGKNLFCGTVFVVLFAAAVYAAVRGE